MKALIRIFVALLAPLALMGCRQPANTPLPKAALPPVESNATQSAGATATASGENYLLVQPEHSETPAPTLKTETGMLPETQTFVNHTSAAGKYDIQAPDTWKKEESGTNLKFTRGESGLLVEIIKTTEPFSIDSIKGVQVAGLVRTGRAVDIKIVTMTETKGGQAVYVEYESNSEPAKGKQHRLINHRYYFERSGSLAVLTLWAPAGADNENIWKQIPDTFYWR